MVAADGGHLLPHPTPQPSWRLDWFRSVGRWLVWGFQDGGPLKVEGQGLLPVKQGTPHPLPAEELGQTFPSADEIGIMIPT